MLDHSAMSCETDGTGNRMSSCTSVHQAEDTMVQELPVRKDECVTCEVGEDADTMLNSGIAETLGDMDNTGSSYWMAEGCIGGKLDREALISTVDLGVEFSSYEELWSSEQNTCLNQNTEEEQNVFGIENLSDQPGDEKISPYLQDDRITEGKQEEGSQKNNETMSNGNHETFQSEHQEQMVETAAERAPCDIMEMHSTESNLIVVGLASVDGAHEALVEEKETPRGFSKSLCGVEQKSPNASDAMDCPSGEMGPRLVGTPEKQNLVVLGLPVCVDSSYKSPVKIKETPHHGLSKDLLGTLQNPDASDARKGGPGESTGLHSVELSEKMNLIVLGLPVNGFNESAGRKQKQEKTPAVPIGKKYPLRSSKDYTRASCSRSREKPEAPRPSTILEIATGSTEKRRGKNKTKMTGKTHDEFARMRRHLRYLLKRIQCEQHLLDAYSSEGWRGQSIEKLRPEKELERANAEINRSKLKIRDLFQRLDSLACEGKFPESLFDSEGLIDSEDIFCAKCGTKDSGIDNDIILCDGACDRGFHQRCLEPPLQTEEIPPDDEGWLCPACDCKVDCLELLNDSHGTKLSVEDSWEKVFPDIAAAAMAGSTQDHMMGLPSDDSEDNDYNPDGTDDDDEVEGSKSSSDESGSAKSDSSDFSSASENLKDVSVDETYLGLPSDDSEDDDFNPDAANVNEHDEHQSSSSGFSSASKDLGMAVDVAETSGDHEALSPLLEKDQDIGEIPSMSGRRHVQRLDYKKLYDETYGNACSDSSDDEEWTDIETSKKRKGDSGAGVSASSIADTLAPVDNSVSVSTSKRRGQTKPNAQATNGSSTLLQKSSPNIGSTGKKLPHNKIGDFATQKLYESFKNNQYPDRDMKEKLAKQVGLTVKQVSKWFENARWSFNHHRARMEATMSAVTSQSNTSHNVACDKTGTSSANAKEGDQKTSTPRRSGRLNKIDDDQSNLESGNRDTPDLQTSEARAVHRKRKRSRG